MSSSTITVSPAANDHPGDDLAPGLRVPIGYVDIAAADAAVARVRAAGRARAVAEAELAAAIAGLAGLCEDREHDSLEVAAVLAWSSRFADAEVGWCRHLIEELPAVFAAWADGRIDRHRARVFEDCLGLLVVGGRGDDARAIASAVLPDAGRLTAPRLRAKLLRLVLQVDPAARRKQADATISDRDVWLGDGGDGATASLTAFNLPVARAAAAFERVDAIARARRAGGDVRTLAQLRADTVLDLLDGTGCAVAPIARQGVLELQIPLATALGADDAPGELVGYGPVLADVARQIAGWRGDAQWRFSVTYKGELVYQGITAARPQPSTGGTPDKQGPGCGCVAGGTGTGTLEIRGGGTQRAHGGGRAAGDLAPGSGASCSATRRSCAADAAQGRGVADAGAGTVDETDVAAGHSSGATAVRATDCLTGEPITGVDTHVPHPPVEIDPGRRFPGAKLKRWIATRDRTCRAPGCHAPARACQYDHTIDYADGGLTSHDDLALLCERHHPEKHGGWWTVIQPTPGQILWITPHGHVYQQPD